MNKLLPVFALLVLFISAFAVDNEKIMSTTPVCMNKTQVTQEMIQSYKPSDGKPSEELLCFIKCTFEEMGYIKADGSLCIYSMKKDNLADGNEERLEKVYTCLEGVEAVKECEDAWTVEQCFNIE